MMPQLSMAVYGRTRECNSLQVGGMAFPGPILGICELVYAEELVALCEAGCV